LDVTVVATEDANYTFSPADFIFTDPIDLHTFDGLVIDNLPENGTLAVSGIEVVAGQTIDLSDLVGGEFIYQPALNVNGSGVASFDYRVKDSGPVDNNGDNYSLTSNTVTIDITSVNDAPMGQSANIQTNEGSPYQFASTDFGFSDVDGDQFERILFTQLPQTGQLVNDFLPVMAGQTVTTSDIDAGLLTYIPPSQIAAGSSFNSIGFRVVDDGRTDNSGIDTDSEDRFIAFDVAGINDAPTLIVTDTSYDEGSQNTLTVQVINAVDVDDDPSELLLTISSLPQNGTLLLNGVAVSSGATLTVQQLLNEELVYLHDGSETSADRFQLSLQDGGENGSEPVTAQFNIDINEVIDPAPVLTDDTLNITYEQSQDGTGNTTVSGYLNVLDNDVLSSTENYTVELVDGPMHGTIEFHDDGTFSYVHNGGNTLQDSFTYSVTNVDNVSATASVSINIEQPIEEALPGAEETDLNFVPVTTESESDVDNNMVVSHESTDETSFTMGLPDIPFTPPDIGVDNDDSTDSNDLVVVDSGLYTTVLTRLTLHALDEIVVKQHNQNEGIDLSEAGKLLQNRALLEFDIKLESITNTIDNRYFQNALGNVQQELKNAEDSQSKRIGLGSDAAVGVSISLTAGVMVWVLRGGALLASMLAATPLWSNIDPVKILTGKTKEDNKDDSVERVFD